MLLIHLSDFLTHPFNEVGAKLAADRQLEGRPLGLRAWREPGQGRLP